MRCVSAWLLHRLFQVFLIKWMWINFNICFGFLFFWKILIIKSAHTGQFIRLICAFTFNMPCWGAYVVHFTSRFLHFALFLNDQNSPRLSAFFDLCITGCSFFNPISWRDKNSYVRNFPVMLLILNVFTLPFCKMFLKSHDCLWQSRVFLQVFVHILTITWLWHAMDVQLSPT